MPVNEWSQVIQPLIDAQNKRRVYGAWSNVLTVLALVFMFVLWQVFGVVRSPSAEFAYVGGHVNEHGVVLYDAKSEIVCQGEAVEWEIHIDVYEPIGHIVVKSKVVTTGGGQVTDATESDRLLPVPAEYRNIPRSQETAELEPGLYFVGTSARTQTTESGMYLVPFEVVLCDG